MPSDETPLLTYLVTNDPAFRRGPRLGALYSDFTSLRTTNPDGYTANISTWLTALSHASLSGHLSSLFSINISPSLLQSLESKQWGRPLALGTVVQEGIAKGVLVPEKEFLSARESVYASRWRLNPLELVGWGLRRLGLFGVPSNNLPRGEVRFVVLGNLEEASQRFESRIAGLRGKARTERVWTRSGFVEELVNLFSTDSKTIMSDSDFDILLKFLDRDKGVLVYDKDTVKLKADGETNGITQEDTTIASLKTLIKDLEVQVKSLERRVEELAFTAKQAVEKKSRISALVALRSKKLAETTLGKRHATLAQLEEVFVKIEQANDQVELVRIMEASTTVLAALNKQVGGVERVDSMVDGLREEMARVSEVGDVLAEPGRDGVNEGEVDEELEEMERVEREKREGIERKEREEREMREAEETRKRLDALEEVERHAREMGKTQDTAEQALEESTDGLKRMSLDPTVA